MFSQRPPWSLLRTQWIDVPVGADGHASPTWEAFSEVFEGCLQGVFRHVDQRMDDRSSQGGIVTAVLVENLDVLVSPLGEREKLGRLFAAADRLIARRASAGADEPTDVSKEGRGVKGSDQASDA